jgi:MraZ protein
MNRFNDKYLHSLDQRGRLQLSRDIRAGFKMKKGDTVHLMPNPGNPPHLSLWTESGWTDFLENLKAQPSSETKRNSLRFIRLMHEKVTADGQGRIVISQRLRSFCHIEKEVAIIDMGDYIEAWNKDAVEQKYNDMLRAFNEINELLF